MVDDWDFGIHRPDSATDVMYLWNYYVGVDYVG